MSIYASIRHIADNQPNQDGRAQIIAYAIALALGTHYANKTNEYDNPDNAYLNTAFQDVNQAISEITQHVLFDVRKALELTKQFYRLILTIKGNPIRFHGLVEPNTDLFTVLFDSTGMLSQEELAFFKENSQAICAMAFEIQKGANIE